MGVGAKKQTKTNEIQALFVVKNLEAASTEVEVKQRTIHYRSKVGAVLHYFMHQRLCKWPQPASTNLFMMEFKPWDFSKPKREQQQ